MNKAIKKIKKWRYELRRKRLELKRNKFIEQYIFHNKLDEFVDRVKDYSKTTGAGMYDYITLHSYIRKKKPTFILECGTGRTTWIIADALKKNYEESGQKGKVISMESIEHWYNEAVKLLPSKFKDHVEIHYSKASTYQYSFIKGTVYQSIPDHEYDLFFVDGPELEISENGRTHDTVNMDFIRYLESHHKPVSAIIDCRMRTSIAYGIIFGKNKIEFLNKPWLVGIIKDVTSNDLLLNKNGEPIIRLLQQATNHTNKDPFWLVKN